MGIKKHHLLSPAISSGGRVAFSISPMETLGWFRIPLSPVATDVRWSSFFAISTAPAPSGGAFFPLRMSDVTLSPWFGQGWIVRQVRRQQNYINWSQKRRGCCKYRFVDQVLIWHMLCMMVISINLNPYQKKHHVITTEQKKLKGNKGTCFQENLGWSK